VAQLRKALLAAVSAGDIAVIAAKLKEKALAGDLAAIKVLFGYVLGKPTPMPDPDQVERQEKQEETKLETLLGRIVMPIIRRGCAPIDEDEPAQGRASPVPGVVSKPTPPAAAAPRRPASTPEAGQPSQGSAMGAAGKGPPSSGVPRSTNGGSAPPATRRVAGTPVAGRQQTAVSGERLVRDETPFLPGAEQSDLTILGGS
jgi:hypothetical protein